MKAIEIWDVENHVFLTLSQVLEPLPERSLKSIWEVAEFVDADGAEYFDLGANGSDSLYELVNAGARLSGRDLSSIAKSSSQVIWGTFRGFDQEANEPWIHLHAIDSTFWRCETGDIASRQALMRAFQDVRLKQL